MQFGSLTVAEWDDQLASLPPSPPSPYSPDKCHEPQSPPPLLSAPEFSSSSPATSRVEPPLFSLTSSTTPPSSPSKPPSAESRSFIAPSEKPSTAQLTTPPHPTNLLVSPNQPKSASSPHNAPTPMTWAARVASGGVGVAAAPHALPLPRHITRPSRSPQSYSELSAKDIPPSSRSSSETSRTSTPSPDAVFTTKSSIKRPVNNISAPVSNGDLVVAPLSSNEWSEAPHSPPRRRRASVVSLPPRRLRGLINGGNCCFINVVLQALLACDAFRQLLYGCKNAPPGSLLQKFVRLAHEMDSAFLANGDSQSDVATRNVNDYAHSKVGKAQASNPLAVKEGALLREEPLLADWFYDVFPSSGNVGGNVSQTANGVIIGNGVSAGGSQEDAEEFLSFVLNALHEELVAWEDVGVKSADNVSHPSLRTINGRIHAVKGPSDNRLTHDDDGWTEMTRSGKSVEIRGGEFAQSGITDIFGGALRSEVNRARAKPSVTREPFFSLSVDIESGLIRDVEHALCAYFEPEYLEGYTIEGGSGLTIDARKQVLLMQTPQVLILHLKRFSHNSVTGALNKVSRDLVFPETLQVPGKVMHNPASRWGADSCKKYELIAVVTHIGKELAGGHYTTDVRWESGNGERAWFFCDDSKVLRTNLQNVCRKQAYLLFYSAVRSV